MKYVCLIYRDEKRLAALSEDELDALVDETRAYDEALRTTGRHLFSLALRSVETATTIRLRCGKVTTSDGPFAETEERLGGFVLIEASDLDDAVRLASKIPPLRLGCIEVRPIERLRRGSR